MKNRKLKEHFLNPKNMGVIKNPSYQSTAMSDTCSDLVKMMVIIDDKGVIENIKTEVFGCGYSISGTSLFTEIAMGKKAEEVTALTQKAASQIDPDIPEKHKSCIRLPQKAFNKIYKEYRAKG